MHACCCNAVICYLSASYPTKPPTTTPTTTTTQSGGFWGGFFGGGSGSSSADTTPNPEGTNIKFPASKFYFSHSHVFNYLLKTFKLRIWNVA